MSKSQRGTVRVAKRLLAVVVLFALSIVNVAPAAGIRDKCGDLWSAEGPQRRPSTAGRLVPERRGSEHRVADTRAPRACTPRGVASKLRLLLSRAPLPESSQGGLGLPRVQCERPARRSYRLGAPPPGAEGEGEPRCHDFGPRGVAHDVFGRGGDGRSRRRVRVRRVSRAPGRTSRLPKACTWTRRRRGSGCRERARRAHGTSGNQRSSAPRGPGPSFGSLRGVRRRP